MRVAITGATGLIGRHVAAHLARRHDVELLGRRPGSDQWLDLTRPESVAGVDLHGCDALVHCAGVVDEDFREDEARTWFKSTVGMRMLLERAAAGGVGAVAYFSTSHVYGPPEGVIDERTCPAPLTDYAIAHLAAERILARATLAGGGRRRALALRPNAVFGEPDLATFDRWSLIPFSFPAAAVYEQEIVLRSTGEQRRNFVGAGDLAAAVDAFLGDRSAGFQVVNPVGPDTLSVYDLAVACAQLYERITGTPCAVRRPPPGPGEPGKDFTYASVADSPARQKVTDHLESVMRRLMEEWGHGRRYGS